MHTRSRRVTLLALAAALSAPVLFGASPAHAADEEETALDRELDMYWGERREVETIQKRLFLKENRAQFSIYGGVIPNDDFQLFFPVGGRIGYWFSESIGMEVSGAYNFNKASKLRSFLEDSIEGGNGANAEVFLTQFQRWYAALDLLWSPFYGKFGAFETKLVHFDFYFAVGVGVMGLEIDPPGVNESNFDAFKIAGNVGVGVMMYVHEMVGVRLDYRHFFFEFAGEGGGLSFPAEITAGVVIFTPAPK